MTKTDDLSDVFEFEIQGKFVQVVMLGGILNRIMSTVKSIEQIETVFLNPKVQEEVLKIVLSEYDESGKVVGEKYSVFMLPVDVQADLISWVGCHVVNFFGKTSKSVTQKAIALQEELLKIRSTPTPNG